MIIYLFFVFFPRLFFAFSALTLLVGWQKGHLQSWDQSRYQKMRSWSRTLWSALVLRQSLFFDCWCDKFETCGMWGFTYFLLALINKYNRYLLFLLCSKFLPLSIGVVGLRFGLQFSGLGLGLETLVLVLRLWSWSWDFGLGLETLVLDLRLWS